MESALCPVLIGREAELSELAGGSSEADLELPYLPFVEAFGNQRAGRLKT